MNQSQHTFIATIIVIILWHLWIKEYFYDEDEHRWWLSFWFKKLDHDNDDN